MQGFTMPIRCNINVLLARENLKRAQAGEKPITWFDVSKATELTHSALLKLARGDSTRIDFQTIEKLMIYFDTNDVDDIISRVSAILDS